MSERVRVNGWADPVDTAQNWRFERLLAAGYDLAVANELANNKLVDLHQAVELAEQHGAEAAYLRFF